MKQSEILFGVIRVPVDFLMAMAAFWLAYYLRPITDLIPGIQYYFRPELLPDPADYLVFSILASFFLMALFAFNRLYYLKNTHRFRSEFLKIVFWVSAWLMFIIAYYFLVVHQLFFSRIALLHIWIFGILFLTMGRLVVLWIQSFCLRFGFGKRRTLIIGAESLAESLYGRLKKDPHYDVVGALSAQRESRKKGRLKVIGNFEDLQLIVAKYRIEEVIQATQKLGDQATNDILSFCRYNQIKYHFIPDLITLQQTNVEVEMMDGLPIVSLKATSLGGWGAVYKRFFDFLFSLVAIVVLLPVWVVISFLIKLDSPGPVIHKSKRAYRDKVFNVYKFRSMVCNAEALRGTLLDRNERKGPLFKMKRDPRITRIGRFLRSTSIDEFPQLFNVLLGNMSLVGPRPHLVEEVQKYSRHHYQVFAIKPGLTGLPQISGRSDLDFEKEVQLDVYYIENWSPWLDLTIILKSVLVIFRLQGA